MRVMKTTDDIIKDLQAQAEHHEREAARLRAMIAAATGAPAPSVAPQPIYVSVPYPSPNPFAPPTILPWEPVISPTATYSTGTIYGPPVTQTYA